MSRAERLLRLIQLLRRRKYAMRGSALASELGISLRTLYRDIATLQAQGAPIEGEPGVGYVLKPGFTMPPLMFSPEELEAITLGTRWVVAHADDALALAARDALAKIAAVLPAELRDEIDGASLLAGPAAPHNKSWLSDIRQAIRAESKTVIRYRDKDDRESRRVLWPFAIGFFDNATLLAAWCETRRDFRSFRLDRITELEVMNETYPRRRRALLHEWRQREQIAADEN